MGRPKEGSITQGTPMEKMRSKDSGPTTYVSFDISGGGDYYKRVPPGTPYFPGSQQFYRQRPPVSGQRSSPPTGHPSSAYASDQHNNSRQIIINDYYTSQQMQNPPGISSHGPHITQNSIGPHPSRIDSRIDPSKRNSIPGNMIIPGNNPYSVQPRQDMAYRQSPSPHQPQQHQQQRQGVIQRTNSHRKILRIYIIVKIYSKLFHNILGLCRCCCQS
jgi:hypothetical protein